MIYDATHNFSYLLLRSYDIMTCNDDVKILNRGEATSQHETNFSHRRNANETHQHGSDHASHASDLAFASSELLSFSAHSIHYHKTLYVVNIIKWSKDVQLDVL